MYVATKALVPKGGDGVGDKKKMGRPTNNPKNKVVRLRVDDEMDSKLDFCCKKLEKSKSDVIRQGIEQIYDDLKK